MAAFFRRGDSGKMATKQSADHRHALDERERKMVYVLATAALLLLALLFLALGGKRPALDTCKGVLLQNQRNACFLALAGSTGNALVCDYVDVQAQRDSCFVGIAEAQNNASMCGEANHTGAQYSLCLLNVSMNTGNESYCHLLNGDYRSLCTMDLVRAEGFSNLSMCNSIDNASVRNECGYIYYYNGALKSGTASYCEKLPSAANSTVLSLMTTESVGSSAGIGMQVFLLSTLNVSPQSYCYYRLATLFSNSTLCAQTTGLLNQACFGALAQVNSTANTINMTDVCTLLQGNLSSLSSGASNLSRLCMPSVLTSEALSTRNISKCLRITIPSFVYSCITTYAKNYSDASYCSYIINNSSAQQDCYTTVTLSKNRTV